MKYESLKRQTVKTLKLKGFDGGVDLQNPPFEISNNKLSGCQNMWFKDSRLQTRPGFRADEKKVTRTEVLGTSGELKYNICDTQVFHNGVYCQIATSDVETDDYAHYTYVYLVDAENNISPIGKMSFLRLSSDIFYTPINILFYSGKSGTGGGIFALVTLQNGLDESQRYYHIYEIDSQFSEWNRVYDYYVPTIYINGRGNNYEIAHSQEAFSTPTPKILESPNMLNGRFNAYYTSDGHSTSFRLPFANLASESVICRIYYTLVDYVEWAIEGDNMKNTQDFFGKKVSAEIDREKGTVYFTTDTGDYAVPVMSMYNENNIKITATKEIERGFCKVVHSCCSVRNNSQLLLAGGEQGNTVYMTSFENPLYFPQNSCVTLGSEDNAVTALSSQQGKIIAFKPFEMYRLSIKKGEIINEISLLSDNDAIFKNYDSITSLQISQSIGCENKRTVADSSDMIYWLGSDNNIYGLKSVASVEIVNYSDCIKSVLAIENIEQAFAIASQENYILVADKTIVVLDVKSKAVYLWEKPVFLNLEGGFYHSNKFRFICKTQDSTVAFIAILDGDTDCYLITDTEGVVSASEMPIPNSMTTKHFKLSNIGNLNNIDNIYLSLAAVGKTKISVNGRKPITINLGLSNPQYDNFGYKSVRLVPHIYGVDTVYLTVSSQNRMCIGETEISYRITGQ